MKSWAKQLIGTLPLAVAISKTSSLIFKMKILTYFRVGHCKVLYLDGPVILDQTEQVRLIKVRLGKVRLGKVRLGKFRLGKVRFGKVRLN